MKISSIILCFVFIFALHFQSKAALTFSEYLSKRISKINTAVIEDNNSFSPAWFDDIDLRTETNRFELPRQEYSIRFSPLSIFLRNAQKDNFREKINNINLKYNIEFSKHIIEIYEEWLDLLFTIKKYELVAGKLSLLKDETLVREKMALESENNIEKYIEATEDKHQCELQLQALRSEIDIRAQGIFSGYPADAIMEIDTSLFPIDSILTLFENISSEELFANSADYQKLEGKSSEIQSEMDIQSAENNQIFNFFQFQYRGPHDDLLNKRLSLMFSLSIPMLGKNKLKQELLVAENQETQRLLALKRIEFSESFKKKSIKIRILFNKLKNCEAQLLELIATKEQIEKNLSPIARSPIWLLSYQMNILESKINILDLQKEIFLEYVDYLAMAGYFLSYPQVNFLARIPDER